MSNIEDTIYNLPNDEYHKGERFKDFLSSTQIKDYMAVSYTHLTLPTKA